MPTCTYISMYVNLCDLQFECERVHTGPKVTSEVGKGFFQRYVHT